MMSLTFMRSISLGLFAFMGALLASCSSLSTNEIEGTPYKPDTKLMVFNSLFGDGYEFHISYSHLDSEYYLEYFTEGGLVTDYEVVLCSPATGFKCISSVPLTFSVPFPFSPARKEWVFMESHFEIIGQTSFSHKGKLETFYFINGYKGDDEINYDRFVYNEDIGLIYYTKIQKEDRFELLTNTNFPIFLIIKFNKETQYSKLIP